MVHPDTNSEDNVPSLAGKVFRGTVFSIVLRFVVRLMGLVSLSVTARLLTPEDFGVVGTASLVIGLFLILRQVGMAEALIREKTLTRQMIRTMWTLRIIVSATITVLLYLSAGPASMVMNEPRAEAVLQVLAFVPLIESLASPANAYFIRNFNFAKDFMISSLHKFSMVVATIYFAFTLQTYWALVYGQVVAAVFLVIISQALFPLKPIPSLKGGKRLSIFAFWSAWRALAMFFVKKGDEFVVRRLTDTAQFGIYHASRDLSRIFISEMIGASAQVFLSAIARLRDETARFAGAIGTMLSVAILIGAALSTGLALVGGEIVLIVLGSQWIGAAPILAVIGFGVAAQAVSNLCLRVFTVLDRQHQGALLWTFRAFIVISACAFSGIFFGVEAVPYAFSLVSISLCFWEIGLTYHIVGRPVAAVVKLWVRPVVAAGLMYLAVSALPVEDLHVFLSLILKVGVGGLTYVSALLCLWYLAGQPKGGETAILTRLTVSIPWSKRLFPALR